MSIDYEKEYNNRARVPEHPEIFARWRRETEAYRKIAARRRARPVLRAVAAPDRRPVSRPKAAHRRRSPCSFTAAGGARSSHRLQPDGRRPNAQGVTVAVVGYDLCPQVTIAAIIEQMRAACLFCGASSGKRMHGRSAIPPAGISPPAWWRPISRRSHPTRRPIWCRWAMRFPACTISRRYRRSRSTRTSSSTTRSARACRRSTGACRRAAARCRGRRHRIERIPAPEPDHRRGLAEAKARDALRGDRRHKPFHRHRSARRCRQRDDQPRGGDGEASRGDEALEPIAPRERDGEQRADHDHGDAHRHGAGRCAPAYAPARPPTTMPAISASVGGQSDRALRDEHDRWRRAVEAGDQVLGDVGGAVVAVGRHADITPRMSTPTPAPK